MSKPGRLRRWARRLGLLALLLLLIGIGTRLALPAALPSLLNGLVADAGLEVRWDELYLVLRRGELEVDGLTIAAGDDPEQEPFVEIEHVRVDLDVREMLRGQLIFRRLYVDRIAVTLERRADGSQPFLDRVMRLAASFTPDKPPPPKEQKPIEFGLPFELRAGGIQGLELRWRDATMSPPVDVSVFGALHVNDLGSRERDTRLDVALTGPGVLDLLWLEGTARSAGQDLTAELQLSLAGFRPRALGGLLALAGLEADAEHIDGDLGLTLRTKAAAGRTDALEVTAEIDDFAWIADERTVVEVPSLVAGASALSLAGLEGGVVELDGARLEAAISTAGPQFLGFALKAGEPPAPDTDDSEDAGDPWPLELRKVAIRDSAFHLRDRTRYPEIEQAFHADAVELGNLALGPDAPEEAATFAASVRAPGLIETLRVDGVLAPEGPGNRLDSEVRIEGIALSVLEERLEGANLKAALDSGTLECHLFAHSEEDEAGLRTVSFGLEGLVFADVEPLIEIDHFSFDDVVYDRTRSFLRIGNVELAGTRATATLDPGGSLTALGLRTLPTKREGRPPTRNETLAESINTLAAGILPRRETVVALLEALLPHEDVRFELGGLDWRDGRIALIDEGPIHEFSFDIQDLGATLDAFAIGGGGDREETNLRVWLRSPGDFEELLLEGTVGHQLAPVEVDARLTFSARDVNHAFVEPLLRLQGLEPTFDESQLGATLEARLSVDDEGVSAEGSLSNLFVDSSTERLAGVEELALRDLRIDDEGVSTGEVELVRPTFRATREADGRLDMLGLRPLAVAAVVEVPKPREPPETSAPAFVDLGVDLPPALVRLDRLRLREGVFEWNDVAAGFATALSLDGQVDDFRLEEGVVGARYSIQLDADGRESLALDGDISLGDEGLSLTGSLAGSGISGERAVSYLPAGVTLELESGRIAFDFEGRVGSAADGALTGEVAVRELAIADGDGPPLASLKETRLSLDRADLAQGEILLDEVSVLGAEVRVVRSEDGTLRVLGLRIDPPAASADPESEPDAADPSGGSRKKRGAPLRTLRLGNLDLDLARLELIEEGLRDGASIELGARVTSLAPLDLLTPESEKAESLKLALHGFVRPFVESIQVEVQYTPALLSPTLTAKVLLDGLEGDGLLEVFPELEGSVDASGLLAESIGFQVEAGLELARRGDDFGLVVIIADCVVRDEAGEPLGGFDRLFLDAPRVDPTTGDVHIRTLGLLSPRGRTTLGDNEVQVAGVIIKSGSPETARADRTPAAPPPVAKAQPRPAEPAPAEPAGGEVRIDELTISGIDLLVVDAATDPQTTIPIDDLYVDVRGISNRALEESRPIRFDAYANAGVTEIPGNKSKRVAFEELAVEGWMDFFPTPTGWFRIDVAALDLLPLRMRAAEAGIHLKNGMLDTSIRASLRETELKVEARSTFTDLVVSESKEGPIQSTLKLPVPLNVAIALLEDSNGELVVPLSFTVGTEQLSRSQLMFTVTATLSQVLIKAIAQAPFRIGNTATQLIGLSSRDERRPPRVERIGFEAGDATLEPEQRALVAELRKVLSKGKSTVVLSHEMGTGDRALVVERATPSREESLEFVERLRQTRRELAHSVTLVTARGRTRLAIGDEDGWRASAEEAARLLSEMDRISNAVEEMSQLLRIDAAEHRVHRESLLMAELGWLRIESVYAPLTRGLDPEIVNRVLLRRPLARNVSDQPGGGVVVTVRERK